MDYAIPQVNAKMKNGNYCQLQEADLKKQVAKLPNSTIVINKLFDAAQLLLNRKAGKARTGGHAGRGGRWYPTETERQICCDAIREPSRAWPRSLQLHCCTSGHMARLFNVNELELKRAAWALSTAAKAAE
jgi:hypothetical protein